MTASYDVLTARETAAVYLPSASSFSKTPLRSTPEPSGKVVGRPAMRGLVKSLNCSSSNKQSRPITASWKSFTSALNSSRTWSRDGDAVIPSSSMDKPIRSSGNCRSLSVCSTLIVPRLSAFAPTLFLRFLTGIRGIMATDDAGASPVIFSSSSTSHGSRVVDVLSVRGRFRGSGRSTFSTRSSSSSSPPVAGFLASSSAAAAAAASSAAHFSSSSDNGTADRSNTYSRSRRHAVDSTVRDCMAPTMR
mmetsp:Transcript_8700/g.26127  ORF Transcript_8700/g.26127 Transcript_8700/m.26127 type:complete len:248 (+) Transcript_8700:13142-13885(+)